MVRTSPQKAAAYVDSSLGSETEQFDLFLFLCSFLSGPVYHLHLQHLIECTFPPPKLHASFTLITYILFRHNEGCKVWLDSIKSKFKMQQKKERLNWYPPIRVWSSTVIITLECGEQSFVRKAEWSGADCRRAEILQRLRGCTGNGLQTHLGTLRARSMHQPKAPAHESERPCWDCGLHSTHHVSKLQVLSQVPLDCQKSAGTRQRRGVECFCHGVIYYRMSKSDVILLRRHIKFALHFFHFSKAQTGFKRTCTT